MDAEVARVRQVTVHRRSEMVLNATADGQGFFSLVVPGTETRTYKVAVTAGNVTVVLTLQLSPGLFANLKASDLVGNSTRRRRDATDATLSFSMPIPELANDGDWQIATVWCAAIKKKKENKIKREREREREREGGEGEREKARKKIGRV
jgi:hypothetical protein